MKKNPVILMVLAIHVRDSLVLAKLTFPWPVCSHSCLGPRAAKPLCIKHLAL